MTILADLASRLPFLRKETTGTEALGLILRDPVAASALTAALRSGAVHLPQPLTFTTEVADSDGRPDLVGRDGHREVLLIEGKFWAGFTHAQSQGHYVKRLLKQHATTAKEHPHRGALLFVVPPARVSEVASKLREYYKLGPDRVVGEWRFADTAEGVVVSVCSWQRTLETIIATGNAELVADCRQLLALANAVDESAFVPWTEEHLSDRDSPKRFYRLAGLVTDVRDRAIRRKVATHTGGRRITIKKGGLAYGKTLTLGGVPATLSVATYQWSKYGISPVWLSFKAGAPMARTAFGPQCRHTSDGVAVPVPFTVNSLEDEVVNNMVAWLEGAAAKLKQAREAAAAPSVILVDDFSDDDEE